MSSNVVTGDGPAVETRRVVRRPRQQQTEAGKKALQGIGAAVILPRESMAPGHYKVALTESGKTYEWSFTGAAPTAPAQSATR